MFHNEGHLDKTNGLNVTVQKKSSLRPASGLDQSGLNFGMVLILDILIIAYILYDNGLF
jgi:hypothetical protein